MTSGKAREGMADWSNARNRAIHEGLARRNQTVEETIKRFGAPDELHQSNGLNVPVRLLYRVNKQIVEVVIK